ncbi:MAG: hypothetical protein ACK4MV_15705 [Beijerinckiaceae bacterium]
MFGLELWEIVMIATGAFWGAWFMRRRAKKLEEEQKRLAEEEAKRGKRNRR